MLKPCVAGNKIFEASAMKISKVGRDIGFESDPIQVGIVDSV